MASAASSGLCHFGVTDSQKRWLVFGIALNKILIPHVRPSVEHEVNKEYNTLKKSHSIDSQSSTFRLKKWHKWLKYENINGNDVFPRLPGGKYDYCNFNCQVLTHIDFAKLYLENYMVHFNTFNDHLDASAVLLLLGRVPVFPGTVQAAANSVRNERNDWAHCVFSKWNETKFQHSFAELKDLVKAMALPSSDEGKIVGELKDWESKETQLYMNSPVDRNLLQLVDSLANDVKNWSEELKEEKDKVEQQLQIFRSEIKKRLGRVETEQRRLMAGQKRLGAGLQRLETGQKKLKTDQIRLGNELQRLESDHKKWKTEQERMQSDADQRVIKCEDIELSDLKAKLCQNISHTVVNAERFVQLMRRNYSSAMLCPFLWCKDELQFKLDNIFTRLQIVSKTKERSRLTNVIVNMTNVFKPHADCKNPRVVLIEGNPAMGKTTYCQKLAYDWSLSRIPEDSSFPKVEILFLLKCRDMNVRIANIRDAMVDQLLPEDDDKSEKNKFFDYIRDNQSRILLVLDGLDESKNKDLFLPLIQGKVLSNIYLLLTARPEMGAKVRRYCDSLLQIVGYTDNDVNSYIERYFRNHSDPGLAKKLKSKLDNDDQLKELTSSPMITALLCLICEETNGMFPTKQTKLYEVLVSCAIRRYFAKRGVELGEDDPSERCRDQLNQLGKMALEALVEDRLYFSREELRSEELLQLCFVTREPSTSKMKTTQCYAFAHKTLQEYFAALHLANEVLTDSKKGEALLLKVSPVDNWQVWKFLFPLVAKKDGERAVFLVSCLGSSCCRAISKADNDIAGTTFRVFFYEPYFYWTFELSESELSYNYVVTKVLDAIAACEDYDEELSDWQKKMLVKLAECMRLEKLDLELKSPRYLLAVSEYLRASSTLIKLRLHTGSQDMSKLAHVLRLLDKLEQFDLNTSDRPSSLGTFQSIPQPCPRLTHFSIQVRLSKEDIPVILDDLCTNETLTHLDLQETGISDKGAMIFAKGLQRNVSLTHLSLGDDSISTVGFKALAQALHTNRVLTHLDLSDSALTDEVAEALGDVLAINCTLTHLNLMVDPHTGNSIGPSGASALARALTKNRTLKCLVLRLNPIRASGAQAFANALQKNSTLTQLDLCDNDISNVGTQAIFKAVQSNHLMTHLDLGGNTIGDSGAEALAGALQSPTTQLSYLQLVRCEITSLGVKTLAEALRTNRSLMYLNLEGTNVARSAAVLAEALQSNRTLTHLGLSNNMIGSTGATQLAQTLLDKNNTLVFLDLTRNRIGTRGKEKLALVKQKRSIDLRYEN
ncbi:protein NLRC3-like [Acropora millepora]|uniref:protein NLRC3-like n=1 Tax=Acropora millepora TaxID=45264 RepID=UPI001CF11920|nr:protein NLRC3-like [Acropora millepora]